MQDHFFLQLYVVLRLITYERFKDRIAQPTLAHIGPDQLPPLLKHWIQAWRLLRKLC